MPALAATVKDTSRAYRYVSLDIDNKQRTATLTVRAPSQAPQGSITAEGVDTWSLRAFRELDNALQRALILQNGCVISAPHLRLAPPRGALATFTPAAAFTIAPAAVPAAIEDDPGGNLGSDLRLREYQIIVNVLKDTRGSRSDAAERLGISARTLRYKLAKMRECGLDVDGALRAAS